MPDIQTNIAPADAASNNWVDRYAPAATRPWLRLMRADRPVGTWLLILPCLHGMALAVAEFGAGLGVVLGFTVLFAIGAFVMRGAGCAYNDIVDRDFDAKVERTANRPLPSGQISVKEAWALLIGLCLIGLAVLLQFNTYTIFLGLGSLALVALYPFAKRVTWWPQAWLGLTFNWGALVGYASIAGTLSMQALLVYAGGVFWTLGYDTIYAHQDREDDALIGVKSSALRLGEKTRPALYVFYGLTLAFYGLAYVAAALPFWGLIGLVLPAAHFYWQIKRTDINDETACLAIFKSNRDAGFMLLAPLLLAIWANTLHVS